MLLWFKDLMNVTEKLQFIDPTFRHSCIVPSSGVIYSLHPKVFTYAQINQIYYLDLKSPKQFVRFKTPSDVLSFKIYYKHNFGKSLLVRWMLGISIVSCTGETKEIQWHE